MASLLKAEPRIATTTPAPLLAEARAASTRQLADALSRLPDRDAAVELIKQVRTGLRRTAPDEFYLRALADAGGVWSTPGATHCPAAWLTELFPAGQPYLATPAPAMADRLAESLAAQLIGADLPSADDRNRAAHVLQRIGALLQHGRAKTLLGTRRSATVHAVRNVGLPLLDRNEHYRQVDLLVPVRCATSALRLDIVFVATRKGYDDFTVLEYARRVGALPIRLARESTPPSLFATDLLLPARGRRIIFRPASAS